MKTNYFLKTFAAMLCVFFAMNVSAKDITVKANGTDSDLAAALNQAQTGDRILISGIIKFNNFVTVEKNVQIVGVHGDGSDMFDGQGKTRMFEINPEPIDGAGLTFKDLGFTGGYNSPGDGGVGRIIGGNTEFLLCWFESNKTEQRGGVWFVDNEGTYARFAGCDFNLNISNLEGAVMFAGNGTTSFEYCHVTGNNNITKRGSFVYLAGGNHSFYYTAVDGNLAGVDKDHRAEGGTIVTAGSTQAVTMESCSVTNNQTWDHGTAFFLMGKPNFTLINSTVANNYVRQGAGTMFIANDAEGIDITLMNTTYVANISDDNAGNAGGGIRVMNLNNRIHILNSIVCRNTDNQQSAVDMTVNDIPGIESGFIFKNSIYGLIGGISNDRIAARIQDNPNIPTKSKINMYRLADEADQLDYVSLDQSGVDFIDGLIKTDAFGLAYYTLETGGYATKLGDPALLADYDTNTDQLLVTRAVTGGTIFAGAVQSVVDGGSYDDYGWQSKIISHFTGINTPSVKSQDIRIIGTVKNGILGVDFGSLKGHAVGTLINIAGQEVEKVFDLNVISKGYYVVNAVPGVYILKVNIEGQTYAQKVIVEN